MPHAATGSRFANHNRVLTVRQSRILGIVRAFIEENGYSPSVRDVARIVGCAISTAAYQLRELELAGRIESTPGIARSFRAVER